MRNILILEDRAESAEALTKLLKTMEEKTEVFYADNIKEAYQITLEEQIDLFLVDIVLDTASSMDLSGLNFVKKVREINRYAFTPVIFITSLQDPQLTAYKELHCYSYITKPIVVQETRKIIEDALKFPVEQPETESIYFRKDGMILSVKKSEIVTISNKNGRMVVTTTREEIVLFYSSCKAMLKELKSSRFVQCNRNYIVNRDFIQCIDKEKDIITLRDGYGTLKIGKTMKKEILDGMKNA